ncbi:MAG TPA: GNAT family N-acetyltransferase [Chryseolinea sp.]|nr:GNAT family N-acetyltransferase [Chryseolinea sp.]
MTPRIFHQFPTAQEYNELRHLAEWPTYEEELVERAYSNTLFSVVARDESGLIIGMGRILGDNAIYLHVQDVIVHPAFQRQGIGKLIMDELLAYIEKVGVKNTNVGLMCSKGREKFYESFGFIERPNEKFGAGMIKILQ